LDTIGESSSIRQNVKARVRVLSAYSKLCGPAPFSKTVRFPDDLYVHLDNESIKLWFEQLLHAIDLSDRLLWIIMDCDLAVKFVKESLSVQRWLINWVIRLMLRVCMCLIKWD